MPWKKTEPMDQRREFALKALGTLDFRALCQDMESGQRPVTNGERGLCAKGSKGEEESRRPLSSPKQLSEVVVCEMVKLKLGHRYWGPRKIRTLYQRRHGQAPSESSFKRVLEQVGLTQPREYERGLEKEGD